MFDYYPKYHMKILLGDFSTRVGRENVFKLGMRIYIKIVVIIVLE